MISYKEQQRLKKRKSLALKLWLFAGAVFLLLVGVGYILFFGQLFDIRTISIKGLNKISNQEIKDIISSWLDTKSYFILNKRKSSLLISSEELQAFLAEQVRKIDSVSVVKKNRHDIDITVFERQASGIWCSISQNQNTCFYFDKNNIAYEETGRSEGFIFTPIYDYRGRNISLGQPVENDIWLKSIFLAKDELKKIGIETSEFFIASGSYDEFGAKTITNISSVKTAWQIQFSTSTDIARQVGALAGLMKDKLTAEDKQKIVYIDLRIPERIYYK